MQLLHHSKKAVLVSVFAAGLVWAYQARTTAPSDPLLAGFRRTTVASVSDAVDQVTGHRGFMDYDMVPQTPGRVVGRATTAVIRPAERAADSTPATAIKHAVEMIDNAAAGSVGVIVVEGGPNMTGLGGLMATAAKAREMAGIVVDGSIRDVQEIRTLGLAVFARGRVPATAVGRYVSVSRDTEVRCGGITVRPGDIVVGDTDGVVVVPADQAQAVLARAREIDERETKMVPFIQKFRSLAKAIEVFNRI
jgi:4-hydroxy-4-methyl-2-oxoglutarate aldolase